MRRRSLQAVLLLLLVVGCNLLSSARVHGQGTPPAERVAFEQNLDAQVPPELAFVDDSGAAVTLGDYFGQGPIVLTLGYYECPMLCSLTRQGLEQSLSELPLNVRSFTFSTSASTRVRPRW